MFEKQSFEVSIETFGDAAVAKNADQSMFEYGTIVELTANAAEGWAFVEWQGAITVAGNPQQLTVTEASQVTAVFE